VTARSAFPHPPVRALTADTSAPIPALSTTKPAQTTAVPRGGRGRRRS
jgi:hypothetical protein